MSRRYRYVRPTATASQLRSRKGICEHWDELVQVGPEWLGNGSGHAMKQEDINSDHMDELSALAVKLAAKTRSTEDNCLDLMRRVYELTDNPIDDSFGTFNMGVLEIAEAFTPVLAGYKGDVDDLVDYLALLVGDDGYAVLAFDMYDNYENTPVGMWATALGPEACRALAEELPDECYYKDELATWLNTQADAADQVRT